MQKGSKQEAQKMMRFRVGAQAATIVVVILGTFLTLKPKPASTTTGKETNPEQVFNQLMSEGDNNQHDINNNDFERK